MREGHEYRGEAWGGLAAQIEEIRDLGDSVLVLGHLDITGRTTGLEFGEELGMLVIFRGGKILRSQDFLSHAEALEAAGLSEEAMSQENVELVREAFEAFNRDDLEEALERMHPEIEWRPLDAFPDAGTYRGREEVREFWRTWRDTFRGFRLHLQECVAIGEHHVLATFRVSGKGAESGVGVESPAVFQLGEIRDRRVIWVGMFSTEGEALEAAGRRE